MIETPGDMTYRYDPTVVEPVEAGVTTGYLVVHYGDVGPARVIPVVRMDDGQGCAAVVPTGEWTNATVVAD